MLALKHHIIKRIWSGGPPPRLDDIPFGHWLMRRNGEPPWIDDHWLLLGPAEMPLVFPPGSRCVDAGRTIVPLLRDRYEKIPVFARTG